MAVAKYSISMPEHILAAIDMRAEGGEGGRSAAIWRNLSRYIDLLNRTKQDLGKRFSREECGLILDSCNGTAFFDPVSVQLLPHGVSDSIEMDGLDTKWAVDGAGLMERLHATSYAERSAIVDGIQLWWNRVAQGEQPDYAELFSVPDVDRAAGRT